MSLDASALYVQVTGRLLKLGKGILLAKRVAFVYAPVAEKWRGWKPKRWTIPSWRGQLTWKRTSSR
ncbi:hypothetical protein SAMN00790413_04687 [Deinococcus hopiensis KR-140]|uniref:Uncharacterized protein n=1 Tax=Deinococcus hopiensis KR-140 TaxID=695939 RepID=A0A1W1UL02_9DEIO|nr:hypothetical protein SAMN00790413_04687 [Deinococcus hopiensis KR-140]